MRRWQTRRESWEPDAGHGARPTGAVRRAVPAGEVLAIGTAGALLVLLSGCHESHPGLADAVSHEAETWPEGDSGEHGADGRDDDSEPVCGNGIVEPGEECDQEAPGECGTPCGSVGSRWCGDCRWTACEVPAETCNGLDDDCNGVIDDVGGSTGCGNGCCNAGEDSCSCPVDCGLPAAPTVPTPLQPSNGARVRSLQPVFRWLPSTAVCGPPVYEVEIDDSCSSPGFASCPFPSPEIAGSGSTTHITFGSRLAVSTTPPVGRRYYWRVRACGLGVGRGVCSAWSPVRYVDVGMAELDFNGDGFSDLAVGAPTYSTSDGPGGWGTGAVYLCYGSAAGLSDSVPAQLVNPEFPDFGGAFGSRVAGSDLDGDGFCDLVVAALNYRAYSSGTDVYVYFGGVDGLRSVPDVAFHEADTRRNFGAWVAGLGDLDADGFGELAIGAPGRVGGNEVLVYLGGRAGLLSTPTLIEHPPPWAHSAFGLVVGPGDDFDGDGYAELVVGAPMFDGSFVEEGRVFVYGGGLGGVATAPSAAVEDPVPELNHRFGSSLGRGDLDGDGFADVVVGAAGSGDEGTVFAWRGGLGGLEDAPWLRLVPPDTLPSGPDRFGSQLVVCDVNGDGVADLVVTAPSQRREATSRFEEGAVFLWYGRDGAAPVVPGTVLWGPALGETSSFAESLACAGDLDDDGYDDLAVGAPWEGRDGRVRVYPGSPTGPAESPALVLDHPGPSADVAGADFGAAIASR